MQKFDHITGIVMSTPMIEMESPFYLTFDIKVEGDVMPACYVGNFARASKDNIRQGDTIVIRNGLIDGGRVVFDFAHLEPHTSTGRRISVHA